MKVRTLTVSNRVYANITHEGGECSIMCEPGLTVGESLERYADELERKSERLLKQVALLRLAAKEG